MKKLDVQLYVGQVDPLIKIETPITRHLSCKAHGGLFTSTFINEEEGSAWVEWCIENNFRLPKDDKWQGWLVYPKKDIKVFEVDSVEDMEKLFDQYSELESNIIEMINFEKFFKEYDALHLTQRGAIETRHPYLFREEPKGFPKSLRSLYGWDVESTHFASKDAIEKVVPIELNIVYDNEEDAI